MNENSFQLFDECYTATLKRVEDADIMQYELVSYEIVPEPTPIINVVGGSTLEFSADTIEID